VTSHHLHALQQIIKSVVFVGVVVLVVIVIIVALT